MYEKDTVSPLDLLLDPNNPRFITAEAGDAQDNIRKYLITLEDVLPLARSIADSSGLMPGERIVVCRENGSYVVLEGNRRTCACQMFLDRSLIPEGFVNRFPATSDTLTTELNQVEVDIVPTREQARRFLAVRHIQRAKEWSTIAKMRFCYEDYISGKTIAQIKERTGISTTYINKYINNYKILRRGLDNNWSTEERAKLDLLGLEPDKLLRMFGLRDTKQVLRLYFTDNHVLKSNLISEEDLDQIIHIWTSKAFIENEMNTRTDFGIYSKDGNSTGASAFISSILDRYFQTPEPETNENTSDDSGSSQTGSDDTSTTATGATGASGGSESGTGNSGAANSETGGVRSGGSGTGGGPNNLPFFGTLNWGNVDPEVQSNKGIIAVCM